MGGGACNNSEGEWLLSATILNHLSMALCECFDRITSFGEIEHYPMWYVPSHMRRLWMTVTLEHI